MPATLTPTAYGWAEPTLMTAYDIVEALLLAYPAEHETDAHMHLQAALNAIENADVAIEKGH